MSQLTLDSPITSIDSLLANRRTGFRTKGPPAHVALAGGLDIHTVGQLLRNYPRRYIDRSATVPLRDLRVGEVGTLIGKVTKTSSRRTRHGKAMVTVTVYDGTGFAEMLFFNQPWLKDRYREGLELAAFGEVKSKSGARSKLVGPDVEILRGEETDQVHTSRIIPVHPATEGVTTRTIRELVYRALQRVGPLADPVPGEVVVAESLIDEDRALRDIHFPEDDGARRRAVDRLKFDELFALELGVAYRKHRVERAARGVTHTVDGELTSRFLAAVPFELTGAQLRAMKEIGEDMALSKPMNRLLQGDVGSGKTVVSLYATLAAVQSGHQATIMAPTEVLAGQHYRTIRALLAPLGGVDVLSKPDPMMRKAPAQVSLLDEQVDREDEAPRVTFALLTAAVTGKDRGRVLEGIAGGEVDLVVGTHALVQEGVEFADLALAVIDEQHRFGVHQRVVLKEKGAHPDVLIMTATPIPRTLALTYYGDLDVSVLDEMPPGRVPATTTVVRTSTERRRAYELVRAEVQAGRQAFVVCAAIDEGNRLEVRAAEQEAARLQREVFPDLRIALLHGRMRPAEKERVMDSFRSGEADVLISTTVIEVGVDVPNATVMLVENAERFGLAQLHQLRGRIGRGTHRSHCVLFDESGPENEDAKARLAAMARTTDGFELADEDLRLRGEGTLFDIKQSGLPDLRLARLAEDAELVGRARGRAFAIIDADPGLVRHPELLDLLRHTFTGEAIEWLFHS
jgi:ATP-dependent DNA helicase RecG